MPSFTINDGELTQITSTGVTNNLRRYDIKFTDYTNTNLNNEIVRGTVTSIGLQYYEDSSTLRTITYGSSGSLRVNDSTYTYDVEGNIKNVSINITPNPIDLLKLNSCVKITINYTDSTTGIINVKKNQRIISNSNGVITTEPQASYLATRTITVEGTNTTASNCLLAIGHNLDTQYTHYQITGITNFTGFPTTLFPIDITSRLREISTSGQLSESQVPVLTIKVFPYLDNVATLTKDVNVTSVNIPITTDPIVLPNLPRLQRLSINNIDLSSSGTFVTLSLLVFPDPVPSFTSFVIEFADNPLFTNKATRTYNQQSSDNTYGYALPSAGSHYFRVTLNRSGFSPLLSNIWKVFRQGNTFEFTEIHNYTELFSSMKVMTIAANGNEVTLRLESDSFLSYPIDSLVVTATATDKTTRTATVNPDGSAGYIDVTISQLDSETTYNFNITINYDSITYDIIDIKQRSGYTLPQVPTTADRKLHAMHKFIFENLEENDAYELTQLPESCQLQYIEYMLSLKSVSSGNYHGIDRNPRNNDVNKPSNQRASRYTTDNKIAIDDIVDNISVNLPEPSEDNDLIQEASF